MSETTQERPYVLKAVVIDDGRELPLEAYSNMPEKAMREWPLFTREQVAALSDAIIREYFQPIWMDALKNFVVVIGYENTLPVPFDLAPFMDRVLKAEEVDDYRGGKGFNISYAKKETIEVDGVKLQVFSFDQLDYYFCRALQPVRAPALQQDDPRPHSLAMVCFLSGDEDEEHFEEAPLPAYSCSAAHQHVCALFTREQVDGILAVTRRSEFQPFWIEEIGTYAVVVGYDGCLPEQVDLEPHMGSVLQMADIDMSDGGDRFWVAYAEKHVIEVDGALEDAFSFAPAGMDFYWAEDQTPTASP